VSIVWRTSYQCEMSGVMHGWTCYLQGPNGEVLRMWPDSTAQVHTLWEQLDATASNPSN
jgi:hypothetical protein